MDTFEISSYKAPKKVFFERFRLSEEYKCLRTSVVNPVLH